MSRNAVMNVAGVKRFIDYLSAMGYDSIQLYTEDTFELNDEPYFGYLRGRYKKTELKEIDAYATSKGVEVIPCIQTLAHLNQMFRWSKFSEIQDFSEELLVDEPKTYEFIEKMLITVKETFKSRKINIGMDEAIMVGLGKYLKQHGYVDRFQLLVRHINRVNRLLVKHGFSPMMWSDLFFTLLNQQYNDKADDFDKNLLSDMPSNIDIVYWDYYSLDKKHYDTMIEKHKVFNNKLWFAGGAWSWNGFTPHNAFSIEHFKNALQSCDEHGIDNVMVTLWGDNGKECSYFNLLPTLFYVACYNKGITDSAVIKRDFKDLTGVDFDDFMALDSANDVHKGPPHVYNPSKYMLYNDCFTGLFDCYVYGGENKTYAKHCNKLKKIINKLGDENEFTYLFVEQYHLCKALSYKYELGVQTQKAYKSNDKAKLTELLGQYKKLIKQLKVFYKSFKELWYKENKPFGFEVQDTRLGGLICRVESCCNDLKDYLDGKLEKLEGLEVEKLNFLCEENIDKKLITYNIWTNSVSASVI